jgi:hypothetical protein
MQAHLLRSVYLLIWRWTEEQLTLRIPTGMKATLIRRIALTTKTLNNTMKKMVEGNEFVTDILALPQQTVRDAQYRTVRFHNRSLLRSEQCVTIVQFLQRFRRSLLSSDQISRRSQPLAFITYSFSGALQTVSKPMVEIIHSQWKQLLDRYNDLSSKTLVNILVCDGQRERKLLQVHFSQNRRSASMPLITSGSRKRGSARRSRSSPRDFCDK